MTDGDRLEFTIVRRRSDYFWGLLVDVLRNKLLLLVFIGLPIAEAVFAYFDSYGEPLAMGIAEIAIRAGLMFGALATVLMLAVFATAWISWRAPGYLRPIAYVISATGVVGRTEFTLTDTAWNAYAEAVETKTLILLRQKTMIHQIIPKRELAAATLNEIKRRLREHLGSRARLQEIAS